MNITWDTEFKNNTSTNMGKFITTMNLVLVTLKR